MIEVVHAGIISDAPTMSEVGLKILNFMLSVFGIISVIGLVISGFFYLTADGNERKIAKAKKAFSYTVIGIFVTLSALIIVRVLASFA